MTRSHKFGERDYSEETVPGDMLPKFFAKAGYEGTDPKKVKKEGGGKGNWGRPTAELEDVKYNPVRPRRRSNSVSFSSTRDSFKSKFEEVEPEPVFEDHMAEALEEEGQHAPYDAMPHDAPAPARRNTNDGVHHDEDQHDRELKLEHQSTTSSDMNGSVDGDRM